MFNPDPGSWLFTHSGSRGAKWHRIPDPQHCSWFNQVQVHWIRIMSLFRTDTGFNHKLYKFQSKNYSKKIKSYRIEKCQIFSHRPLKEHPNSRRNLQPHEDLFESINDFFIFSFFFGISLTFLDGSKNQRNPDMNLQECAKLWLLHPNMISNTNKTDAWIHKHKSTFKPAENNVSQWPTNTPRTAKDTMSHYVVERFKTYWQVNTSDCHPSYVDKYRTRLLAEISAA